MTTLKIGVTVQHPNTGAEGEVVCLCPFAEGFVGVRWEDASGIVLVGKHQTGDIYCVPPHDLREGAVVAAEDLIQVEDAVDSFMEELVELASEE